MKNPVYLLDLACGNCRNTEELYSYYFKEIDGIDGSSKMIEGARKA